MFALFDASHRDGGSKSTSPSLRGPLQSWQMSLSETKHCNFHEMLMYFKDNKGLFLKCFQGCNVQYDTDHFLQQAPTISN